MDQPAVVVAGPAAEVKGAVIGELLGVGNRVLDLPDESYLVLRHGERRNAQAFLPGARQPYPYPASIGRADREPPPRPPRRVEQSLPAPLLTRLTLVVAPAGGVFGPAYNRIVLDAVRRGGALLFTLDAAVPPCQAELDFLAAAAQRFGNGSAAGSFFAVWAGDGTAAEPSVAAYRDTVVAGAPGLAESPWFPVVPGGGSSAAAGAEDLRRALADWSGAAQVVDRPGGAVAGGGMRRRVPTAMDGRESGWEELLDRAVAQAQQDLRQGITVELADVHLRCRQDIVFGGGCAGMPAALDRELQAVSLHCADQVDAAITSVVGQVLAHVLAAQPHDDVLCRVTAALRRQIEEDAPDLARLLLVTSTSGAIAVVPGESAAGALAAYPAGTWPDVLPPLGAGLSASCYQRWRDEKADADAAQAWLLDAVRGTEQQLWRSLTERFEVVRQVLGGLVGDAVDHGMLLV